MITMVTIMIIVVLINIIVVMIMIIAVMVMIIVAMIIQLKVDTRVITIIIFFYSTFLYSYFNPMRLYLAQLTGWCF